MDQNTSRPSFKVSKKKIKVQEKTEESLISIIKAANIKDYIMWSIINIKR